MAVTSLQITQRSLVLDGRPFGDAGAYEKIAGVLRFGVDPDAPGEPGHHRPRPAPRNARGPGRVRGGLLPAAARSTPARGNRRLLLDVPNRGRKVALGMFNSTVRVPPIPSTRGGFRQRLPHAPRLHGGVVRLAARRAARRTGSWPSTVPAARGAPGRSPASCAASGARTRRVATLPLADRYHVAAADAADLDDPGRAPHRARARAARPPWRSPRAAWRFADPTHVDARRRVRARASIYELVYRSAGSAPGRPRPPRGARHRRVAALRARRPTATRARARSSARTSSACRRPGASCATSSTSASTRTRRARRSSTA